jgi:8-oxo-dGTP pyrophosphatase MutT (NUDIX family)
VTLLDVNEKKLGAAALIFNSKGHVLLVKQSYGPLNWDLPGGAAEANESIVETALREVHEETSWQVVPQRTVGIYYDPQTDFHHFTFECRAVEEAPFQMDTEVTQCAFWPVDALPRPISDFTIQRIRDALSGASQILPIIIAPRQWFE